LLWNPQLAWAAYLDLLEGLAEDDIVGRVSIRFTLNEYLAHAGGHIGYGVRPAWRRQGHATAILRRSIEVARAGGVGRLLVVCDDDNIGSAAVIERCGGVLESVVTPDDDTSPFRRYWIDPE
jgi:predicted acetyltransferase